MTILPDLNAKTQAELVAMVQALQAKVAANGTKRISFKVSEKGALSVYGLQKFPVTLYRQQWERLLGVADEMRAFITANVDSLTVKE